MFYLNNIQSGRDFDLENLAATSGAKKSHAKWSNGDVIEEEDWGQFTTETEFRPIPMDLQTFLIS